MDIYLKKAVLTIFDRESGIFLPGETELDLTKEYIRSFTEKKIKGLISAKTKVGKLSPEAPFSGCLTNLVDNFIETTKKIGELWKTCYEQSEDAPSCDVLMALYEEDTELYLAFLKLNYQEGYTHFIAEEEGKLQNQLILYKTFLGSKSQMAQEAFTVNLKTLAFQLQEKKYQFSGEKRFYFSKEVLQVLPAPSIEEQVKKVKKAAEKVGKEFPVASYELVAEVKEAVAKNLEEKGSLDPVELGAAIFSDNYTAKDAFQQELEKITLQEVMPVIPQAKQISEKKYSKQKLKLSNGIELIVPLDIYKDQERLEIVHHPDGTLSVILKNIEEITNQF